MIRSTSSSASESYTKKLSALVFLASFVFLLYFVNQFRNGIPQNFVLFWPVTALMFTSAIYQVIRFGHDESWAKLIFFQVTLLVFLFYFVRVMLISGGTFIGDDDYAILASAKYIENNADFLTSGPAHARWPLFQLITIMLSKVIGAELGSTALYLSPFLGAIGMIFLYLIAKEIYSANRVALLSYLTLAPLWYLTQPHSRFHLQTVGFLLMMALILILVKRLKRGQPYVGHYQFLWLLFAIGVTMGHYTTDVFLVLFFLAVLVQFELQRLFAVDKRAPPKFIVPMTLLVVTMWFVYFMYVGEHYLNFLVYALEDFRFGSVTYSPEMYTYPGLISLKDNIIAWGERTSTLVFGGLIAYEIIRRRKCKYWTFDFMLGFWAAFCFALYLFLNANTQLQITPNRVLAFAYPFIIMIVCHVMTNWRSKLTIIVFSVLLISFMLINVYHAEFIPERFTARSSLPARFGYGYGDGSQEVKAIARYHGSGDVIGDASIWTMFEYYWPTTRIDIDIGAFKDNLTGLRSFSWLYLKPSNPRFRTDSKEYATPYPTLDEETLESLSQTSWLAKVYYNGEWEIYRISHK